MPGAPVLYQEARLPPAPFSSTSTLHIDTTGSSRTQLLRAGSKRNFDAISGLDDETYARKYLATEGSLFFRSKARSPRSFLWRILEDRTVLEVQAVDLTHDRQHERSDSWLTFRIGFPGPILRGGVAFADPEETDALECFVLTEGRELYTVTLKQGLLTKETVPTNFDASTLVRKYTSSSLSFRHPYRMVAVSSSELLVSLSDGGLLHLERKAGESGTQWRETQFSAGGWSGSLRVRGIFSTRHSIKYGELDLDPSAIAAMAKSPDGKHIWTVGLDHWLQAWSVQSGKVVFKQDLLGEMRDAGQTRQQYTFGAEQTALLQMVTMPASTDGRTMARLDEDGGYCIVVHSPKDHQFKFYAIQPTSSAIEGDELLCQDLQADAKLVPPIDELLNVNVWHLEHFHVEAGPNWSDSQLWIRARTGALCNTFAIKFTQQDDGSPGLAEQWQSSWAAVHTGPQTPEELKNAYTFPGGLQAPSDSAVTPNDRWLDFLFCPGRFSVATMETALQGYCKGRGLSATTSNKLKLERQPLQDRLTTAVTSKVILRRLPSEEMDYSRYRREIEAQWETYYSLFSHLHGRRHEPIGFAFDDEEGLAWSICADVVAPVREYSDLERRLANTYLLSEPGASSMSIALHHQIYPQEPGKPNIGAESEVISKMAVAASTLRRSFSAAAQRQLAASVQRDALLNAGNAEPDRVLDVYDQCGFEAEVTDEAFEALTNTMEPWGGLGTLTYDDFLAVVEWIRAEGSLQGRDCGLLLNRYGIKLLVQVAQETLQHAQAVLLDVLTLLTFMAGGLEESELDPGFDAAQTYEGLLSPLRKVHLLLWLAEHTTTQALHHGVTEQQSEVQGEERRTITLLEDLFSGDWSPLIPSDAKHEDMPVYLTQWCKRWALGADIEGDVPWADFTANVLAYLVKRDEKELAVDFLRFVTDTPFSMYAKARLHVMTGEYAEAAIEFRQAAETMSKTKKIASTDRYSLLSPDEQSYFGRGLSAYYQHIASIFEKLQIYSYVADFAKLALEDLEQGTPDFSRSVAELDRKKSQADSPAVAKSDNVIREIHLLQWKETRDDVLNRMFTAYVQTGRFEEAYTALEKIDTPPMQRSNMRRLLDSCIKQDATPTLLSLPFTNDLALEADKVLSEMAKKSLEKGSSTTQNTPPYQILYAFRTQRGDFRGAAETLYEQLERLRRDKHAIRDPEDDTILNAYVLLINTLACCGEDDAWLLAEPIKGLHAEEGRKRKLVTLADVRREYTAELDRRSDVLHGRFPLVADVGGGADDAMDVL